MFVVPACSKPAGARQLVKAAPAILHFVSRPRSAAPRNEVDRWDYFNRFKRQVTGSRRRDAQWRGFFASRSSDPFRYAAETQSPRFG